MDKQSISDILLQSMEIISKKATQDNSNYDITIECKIVNTQNKKEKRYTVQFQEAQFEAFNNSDVYYYNGDIVYVQIPQGDFEKQKFIVGKKESSQSGGAFIFQAPFDTFLPIQDLDGGFETTGFHANKKEDNNIEVFTWEPEETYNRDFKALGIEINIETLMAQYNPTSGSYFFKVTIDGTAKDEESGTENEKSLVYFFDEEDMYGNIYAFSSPGYIQQKVFDVSVFNTISKVSVVFFQDCKFIDFNMEPIPYENMLANIIINEMKVYFGHDISDVTGEPAYIYTMDSYNYGSTNYIDEKDKKTILLSWRYSQDETNITLCKTVDNLKKLWYTDREESENPHSNDNPQYGVFWYKYSFGKGHKVDDTATNREQLRAKLAGANWDILPEYDDQFSITIQPSLEVAKDIYRAVVYYPSIEIEKEEDYDIGNISYDISNEITFTNLSQIADPNLLRDEPIILQFIRVATEADAEIYGDINLKGKFINDSGIAHRYVYDINNAALSNENGDRYSDIDYYVQVQVKTDSGIYAPLAPLPEMIENNNFNVSWTFPETSTMISIAPDDTIDDLRKFEPENIVNENYCKTIKKFRINRTLDERKLNNTISAVVKINGQIYNLKTSLDFGRAGSNGTGYTVVIDCEYSYDDENNNHQTYKNATIYLKKERAVNNIQLKLIASVYDNFSQPVDITKATATWTGLSWKNDRLKNGVSSVEDGRQVLTLNITNDDNINNKLTAIPISAAVRLIGIAPDTPALTCRKSFPLYHDEECAKDWYCYPTRVEFKSDGTNPVYYSSKCLYQKFIDEGIFEQQELYWGFYGSSNLNRLDTGYFFMKETESKVSAKDDEEEVYEYSYAMKHDAKFTAWDPKFGEGPNGTDARVIYLFGSSVRTSSGPNNGEDNWRVRHAIVFDRNLYSSSVLNKWNDQELIIDEENNLILTNALAAGTKSTDNTFTGVILGDWSPYADESLNQSGLYGLQGGAQTFALETSGSGFIGPAGKGRIYFDGNNALISNQSKTSYISLNPDGRYINFLSSKKDSNNYVNIGHDGTFNLQHSIGDPEDESDTTAFKTSFALTDKGLSINQVSNIKDSWNSAFKMTPELGLYLHSKLNDSNYITIKEGKILLEHAVVGNNKWSTTFKINDTNGFYVKTISGDNTFEIDKGLLKIIHSASGTDSDGIKWSTNFKIDSENGFYLQSYSGSNYDNSTDFIKIEKGHIEISGKITAGSGNIGGWLIDGNNIISPNYNSDEAFGIILNPGDSSGTDAYIDIGKTKLTSAGNMILGAGITFNATSQQLIIGSDENNQIIIEAGENPSIKIGNELGLYTYYEMTEDGKGKGLPTIICGTGAPSDNNPNVGRLLLGGLVMIGTTSKGYTYKKVDKFSLSDRVASGTIKNEDGFQIKDGIIYVLDENNEKIPELDANGDPKKDANGNIIYQTIGTISTDSTVNFNPIGYAAVLGVNANTSESKINVGTGYLSLGGSLILPGGAVLGCDENTPSYLIGKWQVAAENASISNTLFAYNGYIENLYVGNLSFGTGGMATEKWVADQIKSEWLLSQTGVNDQINDIVADITDLNKKINRTARIANRAASSATTAISKAVTGGKITVAGSELGEISIILYRDNGSLGNLPLTNSAAKFSTEQHHHNPHLVVGQFGSITLKYNKGYSSGDAASATAITGFAYNLRVDGDTLKWYDGSGTEKSFKKADAAAPTVSAISFTKNASNSVQVDATVSLSDGTTATLAKAGALTLSRSGGTFTAGFRYVGGSSNIISRSASPTSTLTISQTVTVYVKDGSAGGVDHYSQYKTLQAGTYYKYT